VSKVTFDLDRMGAAAHQLYEVRTKMEALSARAAAIDPEGIHDPVMKDLLQAGARRFQLMAHGDGLELAACEHSVRGAMQRARDFDAPSKRPSRATRRHRPKPGGKVRPGGHGKHLGFPGNSASRQQMACWLASQAGAMGAPPELPVVCSLVENGLRNGLGGDATSTGLFQIQVGIHKVPPGFGSASGTLKDERWWTDHPDAQVKWFAAAAKGSAGQGRGPKTTGAEAVGEWAADLERPLARYRDRYRQRYDEAHRLVSNCHSSGGSGGSGGAHPAHPGHHPPGNGHRPVPGSSRRAALGARIDRNAAKMIGIENHPGAFARMQRNAGSSGHAPWCAAYAFNAVLRSGKHLKGLGWATVSTWVQAARNHQQGLSVVSAGEAKPGDLVAYDWDGGNDFSGQHSHIGVLDSDVANGAFKTIEGNTTTDAGISAHKVRNMHMAQNVIFIRVSP
jgi:hypothetical protein